MTGIDRKSPIPIYHQLKTLVREQIEKGLWRPGDRIPTEYELCQLYDISRSPVRQALQELAYEGILTRRPGVGTFVDGQVVEDSVSCTPIRVMSSDPHWSGVLDGATQAWNDENPNVPIRFEINLVDHGQFYNLLSAAVGSGAAPDLAMVDGVWVAGLAQAGFLYALDDPVFELPEEDQDEDGGVIQDLYPAFVEANSLDGRLYGLPLKADVSLLWYRRDWFAQEGLEPPQTWDDLIAVGRHFLQTSVRERYGLEYPMAFPGGVAGGEATVYNLMPFIWSAGGEIFDVQMDQVVFDSPGTRRALQFLQDVVNVHHISPPEVVDYDEHVTPRLLASGQVAMALGGSYESSLIRDVSGWDRETFFEMVGFTAPPAPLGAQPVSTVGGTSYVILRQCPSPALVLRSLKLAVHPKVVGDVYRSMLLQLPRLSFDNYVNSDIEPLLACTSQMLASGRARPSTPEYVKVSRQLQAMFEALISGAASVSEIVARTAEFIDVLSDDR